MKTVYLCGNISPDPETYAWRDKASELLEKYGFKALNPAANKFNRFLLKKFGGKVEEIDDWLNAAIEKSKGILIVKDYNLVYKADIILANLKLVTPEKPPLGTVFELAWAWQLRKPIIAIVGEIVPVHFTCPKCSEESIFDTINLYCKHPFPASTFSATVDNVEDACRLIKEFFVE